jgi:molybdenum storage protein
MAMALVREKDGKRLHIKSKLMGESLVGKDLLNNLKVAPQQRLFPDVNIMKVGGQSISDRGAKALPQVIKEIGLNRDRHKMLVTTGGGTRSRHIYSLGMELGMPTGMMGKFGSAISEQNALMVATLLSQWGGIKIGADQILELSLYYDQKAIPVIAAMPPYDLFSLPSKNGRIPNIRTDSGTIILADLIGAKSCIFIKDEKGLFTDDPKKNPDAVFIPKITAEELIAQDLPDLIIERVCLTILQDSEVVDSIQIINGLEEGNITKALNGEHVGTIIYSEKK